MIKGKAYISDEKAQQLDKAIDAAERTLSALKMIKSGVSEREACGKFDVAIGLLRHFTFNKVKRSTKYEGKTSTKDSYISWQEKIYMELFRCKYEEIPCNVNELIDQIVETDLKDREKEVLIMRYKEAETLDNIAHALNYTRERIRQWLAKGLRKIYSRINKTEKGENNGN